MAKKGESKGESGSMRVNIEIAPGNRSRLDAFMLANRNDPERSRSILTLTDILNEALDDFLSAELGVRTSQESGRQGADSPDGKPEGEG